ncbi:MAG: DUF4388 domain-containing protein [Thermoanaerobaculia bacterium]
MSQSSSGTPAETSILEGKLEDFPLADILQVLQVSGKSGALFLTRTDGQTAVLAFRNGQIVQALSTESYQTLGDRLMKAGTITRLDLHEALGYMAHFPGMRLGDALVDRGYATRTEVEGEVKLQMTETIERLMSWNDTDFEFRIGLVSLGRGVPDFAVDLVLDKGMEPRHILLEASLLQDKRNREKNNAAAPEPKTHPPVIPLRENGPRSATKDAEDEDEEARKIVRWFDQGATSPPADLADPEQKRIAESFLSLSEELFVAQGRGEIGLLLLRYASELYADGGLVIRDKGGFRILGQFGAAFWWGERISDEPQTAFEAGESPLFDAIAADSRPYAGFIAMTAQGGIKPVDPRTPGAVPALAVPLLVLGNVSLILFCRSAVAGAPDARALIALARQVSITLENMTLREMAKRSAP